MGDIDTAVVDSLKVLDPKRPIREADSLCALRVLSILTHSRKWAADFVVLHNRASHSTMW